MSHYKTMDVSEHASTDEIKQAFRALAMQYHPDRHSGDKAKEARFKEISAANEVLSDPEKRAAYDRQLASERSAARTPSASVGWWVLGGAVVAVPIIWKAATSRRTTRVEIGADGRQLPPRAPDGRFMRT